MNGDDDYLFDFDDDDFDTGEPIELSSSLAILDALPDIEVAIAKGDEMIRRFPGDTKVLSEMLRFRPDFEQLKDLLTLIVQARAQLN